MQRLTMSSLLTTLAKELRTFENVEVPMAKNNKIKEK